MLFKLFSKARSLGASDIHLTGGKIPMMRLAGKLQKLDEAVIHAQALEQFLRQLLPEHLQQILKQCGEVDAAFCDAAGERYRLNVYQQKDAYALAIRLLASKIPACEEIGLPQSVQNLLTLTQGLVLVTGATGSGKSTTLAALVERFNQSQALHILTLEDPIEYVYPQGLALINQREIGRDTKSFASGLRSALRQDPDVILVGELRDAETIAIALTAAETGHLVLATLHTQDVMSSISRILDALPKSQQQVRTQLAECLQAVVCQKLLVRADGAGRVAAFEVLIATDALRNLIREGKTHQLASYVQTGARYGMVTMADYIASLKKQGIVI